MEKILQPLPTLRRITCVFVLFFLLVSNCIYAKDTRTPTYHTPLIGPNCMVDNISGGLIGVLSASTNLNNLTDTNLENYAEFNSGASVLPAGSFSVKDMKYQYPAGTRAGFYVSSSALLSVDLLSGYSLKTYLENVPVETITVDQTLLSLDLLGLLGGSQSYIAGVTTQPFDEVELISTGVNVDVLSLLRVHYAYVGPATGNGFVPITTASSYIQATGVTTTSGSVINNTNAINTNLNNSAALTSALGIPAGIRIQLNNYLTGGHKIGFALSSAISLTSAITVKTYSGSTLAGTYTASNLISVLGSTQYISFTTTAGTSFNAIELDISGLAATVNVYYAFVYPIVTTDCTFAEANHDINLCNGETSYNLNTSVTSYTQISGPSTISISASGVVSGITGYGVYEVEVVNSSGCKGILKITRYDVGMACNTPILGQILDPQADIDDDALIDLELDLISWETASLSNIVDSNLSNYAESGSLLSIETANTWIAGVKDTEIHPAGSRAGFVISFPKILLSATILNTLQVRTYLNGKFQEESSTTNVLTASVIAGQGDKQRISFVTTQPFDAIALVSSGVSVLNIIRVYYAFDEPLNGCDVFEEGTDCLSDLLFSNYGAITAGNHTGLTSVASVATHITDISNIVNDNLTDYASISGIGAGSTASISIKTTKTFNANYLAGFLISGGNGLISLFNTGLANANLLSNISVTAYYNGVAVANNTNFNPVLNVELLNNTSQQARITVNPSQQFNELRLTFTGLATLSEINVYEAFVILDSDGDGVADCMDKCCEADDNSNACGLNVTSDVSCTLCDAKITLSISGTDKYTYFDLYKDEAKIGSFTNGELTFTYPDTSGLIPYTIKGSDDGINYSDIKDIILNIHPSDATWITNATSSVWQSADNWNAETGNGSYPVWCTNVTIPGSTSIYPSLVAGDECKDITLKDGASVGKIYELKYRLAYVEFNPPRNRWITTVAPLKYMYSGDYGGNTGWSNAIDPKVFMRYFSINYSTNNKPNPDGVTGTSAGNFSKAFANMSDGLTLTHAPGFALWVNGSNANGEDYVDTNFPTGTAYQFPIRTADYDGTDHDVNYRYHTSDGIWTGDSFNLQRGNKFNSEWTATTDPETDNRYRFAFEDLIDVNNNINIGIQSEHTELIGNPFMSHVDFNELYTDNSTSIYNYYRIWDGNHFYSYSGTVDNDANWDELSNLTRDGDDTPSSGYIAPLQSFFVETKANAKSNVSFTPESSVSTADNRLKDEKKTFGVLRIYVRAGNNESRALLAVHNSASDSYIHGEDIFKLFSPLQTVPEVYTIADQTAMEINRISSNPQEQLVPIGIKTSLTGNMELSITGTELMESYQNVLLLDSETQNEYDLRTIQTIPFTKSSKESIEGRFYISLSNKASGGINHTSQTRNVEVYVDNKQVTINSGEDQISSIHLFNPSGSLQYTNNRVESNYFRFTPMTEAGIYLLKVKTTSGVSVHKIKF